MALLKAHNSHQSAKYGSLTWICIFSHPLPVAPVHVQILHIHHDRRKFKQNWKNSTLTRFANIYLIMFRSIYTIPQFTSTLLTVIFFFSPYPSTNTTPFTNHPQRTEQRLLLGFLCGARVKIGNAFPPDNHHSTAPETRVDIVYTWLNEDTVCRRKSRLCCGGRQWGGRHRTGRGAFGVSQVSPFQRLFM